MLQITGGTQVDIIIPSLDNPQQITSSITLTENTELRVRLIINDPAEVYVDNVNLIKQWNCKR